MGRWVTSQGRRIYIPDEGEEVPDKYKDNVLKEKQIEANKKEADKKNVEEKQKDDKKSQWKVEYSRFGGKQYKSKNAVAAKKSAEEMGGFGKNGLELKHSSSSAIDDTYKLIHKESGLQVGAVVERRVGGATLYMYKATRKK